MRGFVSCVKFICSFSDVTVDKWAYKCFSYGARCISEATVQTIVPGASQNSLFRPRYQVHLRNHCIDHSARCISETTVQTTVPGASQYLRFTLLTIKLWNSMILNMAVKTWINHGCQHSVQSFGAVCISETNWHIMSVKF